MNLAQWFQIQLQASADGFVWGAEQVPIGRRHLQPPEGLGEWTAVRHIFHMVYYEQTIALPSMRQWLGAESPSIDGLDEDGAWVATQKSVESLLAQFRAIRAEQLALIPMLAEPAWDETREGVWGPVTLRWVVSKTYQHTAEHTNDILRIALFWDSFEPPHKATGSR
jgi:hypothetical protein